MIEIKLTGDDAQDYLDGTYDSSSTIEELLQEIGKLRSTLKESTTKPPLISVSTPTSSKILSDAKKLTDIKSERSKPNPFTTKEPRDMVEPTVEVKYKSRLSKQDKIDLHDYAINKVRSNCRVDQFAMKRRLRAVTVETYIDRHSNGKYKVVLGSDIKKWDIWDNAVVDPEKLYIRKA
jgi:hypothetical protein